LDFLEPFFFERFFFALFGLRFPPTVVDVLGAEGGIDGSVGPPINGVGGEADGGEADGGEAEGKDGNILSIDGNEAVSALIVANVNAPIVTIIIPYIITG
jgi:hypothetical protein